MTEEDFVAKSADFSRLEVSSLLFMPFNVESMKKAHVSFRAAFWQDRNILIYIPVETVVNRGKLHIKLQNYRQHIWKHPYLNYGLTALVVKLAPIFFDSEEE